MIRDILEGFRTGELGGIEAAAALDLSRSRFHEIFGDYLRAYGKGRHLAWAPGTSGGDHGPEWPQPVLELLRKRLGSKPPASYSFAASEALRLQDFRLDRAQVRRWALRNDLAHAVTPVRSRAPVRRWQRDRIGELWQLDATPHAWFPGSSSAFPMLNMLDDCSRVFVGSRIYQRELLLAYLDFLPTAFENYGLPLEVYVDYHSMFFTHSPGSLTELGKRLRFYGVNLRYAPTPQAKGKVEREHLFWQNRLPAFFASENIQHLGPANDQITALRLHRNEHEMHRELAMKPAVAWSLASDEGRSVLRPVPSCPWWPYIWSERTHVCTGFDGRLPIGPNSVRLEVPPRTRVVLCHHPDGHHTVLASSPAPDKLPTVLYTNRPL